MRVAMELATYHNPYKVADALISIIESSTQDLANPKDNFSLLIGDVIDLSDEPSCDKGLVDITE